MNVQTTHNPWSRSDTLLTTLRQLAAQGLSAAQIAPHFTTTRNAIIGACHRHQIHLLNTSNNPLGPTSDHLHHAQATSDPRFHNQATPTPAAIRLAQYDPIVKRALQSRAQGASYAVCHAPSSPILSPCT